MYKQINEVRKQAAVVHNKFTIKRDTIFFFLILMQTGAAHFLNLGFANQCIVVVDFKFSTKTN